MPPFRVIPNFLDQENAEALLRYAQARRSDFKPTRVRFDAEGAIDRTARFSVGLRDLGDFQGPLANKVRAATPALAAELRMSAFEIGRVELQLVAHPDGAFYTRHIDTMTGSGAVDIRLLSAVYYFHTQPKRFTGGALRLHAIGPGGRFVDIEPEHNTLLGFPSWAPHEVMPVSCPSNEFADFRFAINCWVHARGREKASEVAPGKR